MKRPQCRSFLISHAVGSDPWSVLAASAVQRKQISLWKSGSPCMAEELCVFPIPLHTSAFLQQHKINSRGVLFNYLDGQRVLFNSLILIQTPVLGVLPGTLGLLCQSHNQNPPHPYRWENTGDTGAVSSAKSKPGLSRGHS